MAAFDTNRSAHGAAPIAGQITRFFHVLINTVVTWNDARLTRNALNSLTDRELEDIGLMRSDIEDVAKH